MKRNITTPAPDATALVKDAWQDVGASFERFCLTAGIATLSRMMTEDAERLCGPRHGRSGMRTGHRWGRTKGKIGFHGGTVPVERPRVRSRDGAELPLPSWEAALSVGRHRKLGGALPHRICYRIGWLPQQECYPGSRTAGVADGEAQHGSTA